MSYDFVVEMVQGALCLATFGAIAVVVWKMLAGTISLRGLLVRRAPGRIEPERLLAFTTAVALPAFYVVHCGIALKDVVVPHALPAVEPWMLAAALASQALYLAGKFLRSRS